MIKLTLRDTAGLCATLSLMLATSVAAEDAPPVMAPAPGIQADAQALFDDEFRIIGPAVLLAPDQTIKYRYQNDEVTLASLPVGYGKTARLDSDVELVVPELHNLHFEMAKGTTLFQARFRAVNAESTTQISWCGLATLTSDAKYHRMFCLSPTDQGKTVGIPTDSDPYAFGFVYGHDSKAVDWFAFALTSYGSTPVDNPVITEADMPSPDMALIIRLEQPTFDKKDNNWSVTGSWALHGPKGGTPIIGRIGYIKTKMPGSEKVAGTVSLTLPTETLRVDYDPDTHLLSRARLEPREMPAALPVPAPETTEALPPTPIAVPKPAVTGTPWRIGVLDFDPASVTVSSGPLHKNDTLLTAKAHLSPRMRLNKAVHFEGNVGNKADIPEGTFVRSGELTTYDPTGAPLVFRTWCFEGKFPFAFDSYPILCASQKRGVIEGVGLYKKDWELNAHDIGIKPLFGVVKYDVSPAPDPVPPADQQVEIHVTYLSKTGIELKIGLVHDGQFVWQTAYSEAWDSDGTARLYLWDRVIVLHHQDDTVTAEVQPSDKGLSPAYGTSRFSRQY